MESYKKKYILGPKQAANNLIYVLFLLSSLLVFLLSLLGRFYIVIYFSERMTGARQNCINTILVSTSQLLVKTGDKFLVQLTLFVCKPKLLFYTGKYFSDFDKERSNKKNKALSLEE